MRLLLVPVTKTSRLVYGQKTLVPKVRTEPGLADKLLTKATKTWQGFEKSETKWKKSVVSWSNKLLERIPSAEWSLRTIPSINTYNRVLKESQGFVAPEHVKDVATLEPVDVCYPHTALSKSEALDSISRLASTGIAHHRKYGVLSVIAMPFTAPVALIPVIPNIPFIYLVYRTWCHWEAYQGAKHLQHLVETKQLEPRTLPALEKTYEGWTGELGDREKERISRIFVNTQLDQELSRAAKQAEKPTE